MEYDRIDLSEGIDVSKCEDTSKKCSNRKNPNIIIL